MANLLRESFADASAKSIIVTEIPDDGPAPGLFGGVLSAYQRHGYEAGYFRAILDVSSGLTLAVAEFIRERRVADPAAHELLREFEAYARQQMQSLADGGFVEGGLGI